jgi:predicted metal-dependent peptidase
MTDDLLAASLAEVEGLLTALGLARRLRVIACDTAAAAAQRVTSARQVELTGGGGTNTDAGIAAAAARRPGPAITVVLTDGLTPDAPARGNEGRRRPDRLRARRQAARAARLGPRDPRPGRRLR